MLWMVSSEALFNAMAVTPEQLFQEDTPMVMAAPFAILLRRDEQLFQEETPMMMAASFAILLGRDDQVPRNQVLLFIFVAGTMDHAFDIVGSFIFGVFPWDNIAASYISMGVVYSAHGYQVRRPLWSSALSYPSA